MSTPEELAEYVRANSSIVPAGTPDKADVLWNALMTCRSFILTEGRHTDRATALRAIDEAIAFCRGS